MPKASSIIPGFLDYRCPVASDMPMIEAVLVEVPNPRHPFGARGVGEVPIVPPMAAIANAIRSATGLRMPDLPMSPPRMLAAIEAAEVTRGREWSKTHSRPSLSDGQV